MSNVLIGVIGVILFIGLALAGALYLGPRFSSAKNDSKAAAVVQQMAQTSEAVSMRNSKLGDQQLDGAVTSSSTLIPRFLKSAPTNAVNAANSVILLSASGGVNNGVATTVATALGIDGDPVALAVCTSIQRQTGQVAANRPFDTTIRSLQASTLPSRAGCLDNGTSYYAFQQI